MEKRENEKPEEPWVLPVKPVPTPTDIETALARAERDRFLAQHAPDGRRMPSILTGRGDDESFGR
jgi:hypothetical protein